MAGTFDGTISKLRTAFALLGKGRAECGKQTPCGMTTEEARANAVAASENGFEARFGRMECRVRRGAELRPLVLWHLLSMDAASVAVCWTWFVAAVSRTRIPLATEVAMGLAVWTLYAGDRLLDTRQLAKGGLGQMEKLEPRHLFHYQHRQLFGVAMAASLVGLCAILPAFPSASLRLYAIEGILMAGYFLLIHWGGRLQRVETAGEERWGRRLPKELLVGPFFAAAVFIPTVSRRPELRLELLPLAALFAGLCSLNCLYIFAWEHAKPRKAPFGTAWAVRRLGGLVWVFIGVSLAMCLPLRGLGVETVGGAGGWPESFRLYAFACACGGLALFAFDRLGNRLSKTTLRAAADMCLLTPLLFFPFLRGPLRGL